MCLSWPVFPKGIMNLLRKPYLLTNFCHDRSCFIEAATLLAFRDEKLGVYKFF